MKARIRLKWPDLRQWYYLPLYSLCVVGFCQGIIHLNPYNLGWMNDGSFTWGNLLQFLVIDQALIECITLAIILGSIHLYSHHLGIREIELTFSSLFQYFLKFIPLFLLIYVFYAPFTTTLRYLYHELLYTDAGEYMQQYFFLNSKIYLMYLFPTFLTGYSFLIAGIVLGETVQENELSDQHMLAVKNQEGERLIAIEDMVLIARKNRKTWISLRNKEMYAGNWTLASLEEMLPQEQFVRINRAHVLRKSYIKNWSHWEDQKYILRSIDDQEFVVSRARIKQIKMALSNS